MTETQTSSAKEVEKMIRRSANAPALTPMSQKSTEEQKTFFEIVLVKNNRPENFIPTDEVVSEYKKCVDQGTYVPSGEVIEFFSKIR